MIQQTREPQYQFEVDMAREKGFSRFGIMSNQTWHDDPRRLVFLLSRYKFVSKILSGKGKVLEVGCADAFGLRLVLQEVDTLHGIDFDPVFIHDGCERMATDGWQCELRVHDMLEGPVDGDFDAAYSLDVIEHIKSEDEDRFVGNIAQSLHEKGVAVIGSPSLESQRYASKGSIEGHVNCKTGKDLKTLMEKYFDNVFLFSMNDEVVHTGFYPMAHYLFAVCAGRK